MTIRRILYIRPDAIGDMTISLPVLRAIRDKFPNAHFAVLASDYNATIINHLDWIDEIILAKKPISIRENKVAMITLLKEKKFDVSIHAFDEWDWLWIAFKAGIKMRLGDKARLGSLPLLWKHGVSLKSSNILLHKWDLDFALLAPLGIKIPNNVHYDYVLAQESQDAATGILTKLNIQNDRPLIGIQVGIGTNSKALQPQTWARYLDTLFQSISCTILLTAFSKSEIETCEKILSLCKHKPLYHRFQNRAEMIGLSGLIKAYDVHVSVDTGPAHIAAALGTPQLSIFPTKRHNPLRWGHRGVAHFVIRNTEPCHHHCPHNKCPYTVCVDELSISEMVEKTILLTKGEGIKNQKDQFKMWFKQSVSILVVHDLHQEAESLAVTNQLKKWGFLAHRLPKRSKNLHEKMIEMNTSVVFNLSKQGTLLLIISALRAAQKLFVPPLVLRYSQELRSDNEIISFVKNGYETRRF